MNGKIGFIGVLLVMALALTGCGQLGASPTLAAGEGSAAYGGGVIGSSYGTFTEGLVVVGVGTASAEPEIAQVGFGVDLRGDNPGALVNEGTQTMNAAIAAAQGVGVAEDDITTTGYSLWTETLYDPQTGAPTGEIVYHFSHSVMVTLRDMTRVGDLLAAVVGAGANNISGVSFSVEDPNALVQQARQQALQNARAQAQAMAQALDFSLGSPIMVMETSGGYYPMDGMGGGGGMAVSAPNIQPGTFSVSVSVQIVYEIR